MRIDIIKLERNKILKETDWMILPDSPLSENEISLIKVYRQELRDLTENLDEKYDEDREFFPIPPFKITMSDGTYPPNTNKV